MRIVQPSPVGTQVEPGIYRAIVTEIQDTESTYEGKVTPQYQLQFVFLDPEGDQTDQEFRGWCSRTWHEKSKLYAWAKVLLGRKCPPLTESIDVDKLVNKRCDLEIISYEKKDKSWGVKIGTLYPYQSMTKEEAEEEN